MGDNFGLQPNNTNERTATERGYEIMSYYETKDEIDHVINQLHGSNIRAFKAHHKISERTAGFSSDLWYLWVKTEDLVEYNRRIKLGLPLLNEKPPKEKKEPKLRPRKETAGIIIKMKDEDHKTFDEIAAELQRPSSTVMAYYYRGKRGEFDKKEGDKK